MRIFKVFDIPSSPSVLSLLFAESLIMSVALDVSKMPIYNSILVAQCRSRCIDKFLGNQDSVTLRACQDSKNCFMCWETCELLNQDLEFWGHMCSNRIICFPGCVESCTYYILEGNQVLSLNFSLMDKYSFSPSMAIYHRGDEDVIIWGRPKQNDSEMGTVAMGTVVYAVVEFDFDNETWSEVEQGISNRVVMKSQKDRKVGFMLLAVNATHVLAKQQKKYSYNPQRSLDQLTPSHVDAILQQASGLQERQPPEVLSRTPRNFTESVQQTLPYVREVSRPDQTRGSVGGPPSPPTITETMNPDHDGTLVTLFIALALNATLLGFVLLYLTYYRRNLTRGVFSPEEFLAKTGMGKSLGPRRDPVSMPASLLDPVVKFSRPAT